MPAATDKIGFPCPHCGAVTCVKDSRPSGGMIRRRRKCSVCSMRTTTFELALGERPPVGLTKALTATAEVLRSALEQVNSAIEADRLLRRLTDA